MIRKLICASLLATSSVPAFAQDTSHASADMFIKFKSSHRCVVALGAQWHAINTKGTGANTGRAALNTARGRIDLGFTLQPSAAGGVPTVSGFAINTKGTGANSGRLASDVAVSCTGTAVAADDASQKAAMQDISITSRSNRQGAGWSCSVTGPDDAPQFVLTLLVPTILGQAERTRGPGERSRSAREDARLESSHKGHRVSIVPRGSNVGGASQIACSSSASREYNWDLAVLKR